jgi:hypothetical protein
MNPPGSMEMSGATHPVSWHYVTEDLSPQRSHCNMYLLFTPILTNNTTDKLQIHGLQMCRMYYVL